MKLFVWDFHGVLEKGNDHAVLEITNFALEKHGHSRRMTYKESEFLSGRRWHEYFSFLVPNCEEKDYYEMQSTCLETQRNKPEIISKHLKINDHVEYVLKSIQDAEHEQILISNTDQSALDRFVHIIGVEKYFPLKARFGVNTHIQKSKTKKDLLKDYIKNHSNSFESLISIGDSPGDMALTADHTNGVGYLYSHPGRPHREAIAHYKINDLRLVLQELRGNP